jgi:hypothetical protein
MDELDEELDRLRFDKGARIRTLLSELQGSDRAVSGSLQQLFDSVRWDGQAADRGSRPAQ